MKDESISKGNQKKIFIKKGIEIRFILECGNFYKSEYFLKKILKNNELMALRAVIGHWLFVNPSRLCGATPTRLTRVGFYSAKRSHWLFVIGYSLSTPGFIGFINVNRQSA